MPPISNRVIFWHTIKTYLFYRLCQHVKKHLRHNISLKQYSVLLAFLGGTAIYKFIAALIDKFLCWLFTMQGLNVMDEFFLYDDDSCLSNTAMIFSFTPFKFEEMSEHFHKTVGECVHLRVRL